MMKTEKPTRAQRMAEYLRTEKERLVAEGVLEADEQVEQTKHQDNETAAQKERRKAAVEKLRTFYD